MKIRKMRLDDVPIVYSMAKVEANFKVSRERAGFWSLEQLNQWVHSEDVLLVAEIEGNIVGFVLTALHPPTGKVYWENQFVLPEYRRQGIARALIKEMKLQLKDKGATYLHFLVKMANPNLHFYEEMGFERGDDCAWFGSTL